jgi:YidC/Oxa1 family membrane protein insertase
MFSFIWHTFFFDPIYNGLVFFIDVIPGGDVGLSIVAITVLVKFLLLPLSIKAARTQVVMREIEPRLKELRDTITDRQEQAKAMMEVYREAGINPFASILLMFIQIPILIALYLSVYSGGGIPLPAINTDVLYSFVPTPETISMILLGFQDITARSIPLAIAAGVLQYIHGTFTIPKPTPRDKDKAPSFKEDMTRNMQFQMRYFMPVIIGVVAYTISAGIALYFAVSAIMSIGQEVVVRRYRKSATDK